MSLDLNKNAVVTGGGSGIGAAIARRLIEIGWQVWITGRRPDVLHAMAKRLGARAACFDASDPTQVQQALPELPETVHLLVNNAGGNTEFNHVPLPEPLHDLADRWRSNFDSNVLTTVLMTEALEPRLAEHARVIGIGSIAARDGGGGSYGAAKAAIEAWAAFKAHQLGARGVTVNVVSPGLIENTEFFGGALTDERRQMLIARTATRRAGTPEDVAELVGFLSGPQAGHITGQVIPVNGGAQLAR